MEPTQPMEMSVEGPLRTSVIGGTYQKKKIKYVPFQLTEEQYFPRYFAINFEAEKKKTVNPFAIIEEIRTLTGEKPKRLFSVSREVMVVEVRSERQAGKMAELNSVEDVPCRTEEYNRFKHSGLIYINEFDITDVEDFKMGLQEEYNVKDVL